MRRPLGFMSGTGAVMAGVVVAGVFATSMSIGPVLFSPGALNAVSKGHTLGGAASHAQIGDTCSACHTAPWSSQTMADRCLVCHSDVASQIRSGNGAHAKLVGSLSAPTCKGCHTDHGGATGDLTVADPATFPHDLTGYSLRSHRRTSQGERVTCVQCHPRGLGVFDQATCEGCHAKLDAAFMTRHVAKFGKTCLACHQGVDRIGSDFDHNKLPFKLTGRHAHVACDQCHKDMGSIQALQSTPTNCYGCHAKQDKHGGRFGQQCDQCHSTTRWGDVNFDHKVFPVDHGRREQRSTCQTCHPNGATTYTCFGCHRHTPANVVGEHEGRSLAQLTDCIQCHEGGRGGGD